MKIQINEARGLKSKKLYDIFKEYGRPFIAKHYDSSEAMDLHNVKDEDVVGVFSASELPKTEREERNWIISNGYALNKEDGFRNIELGKLAADGQILYVVVINRNAFFDVYKSKNDSGFKGYVNKKTERSVDKKFDGAKEYQWKDGGEAKHYKIDNPFYKSWSKDAKDNLEQRIRNTYGKTYDKVKNINESMYTMQDWENDKDLKIIPGQLVSDEVIIELKNCVPPATLGRIFQPGEAYSMNDKYEDLYMTFRRENEGWLYIGLCTLGSDKPENGIDYSKLNESGKQTINLNESQLRQIVAECIKNILNDRY